MLPVTCAIIEHNNLVLAVQRSSTMSNALKWEFAGGKVEANETAEACLQREIREELGIDIIIGQRLPSSCTHTIELIPFICSLPDASQNIQLSEHKTYRWCTLTELPKLDWSAADIPIVDNYIELRSVKKKRE